MTYLQRYLAEEIATDHADGLISRREALRRLGLLGLGAAAASSLLAACGGDDATLPPAGTGATTPTLPDETPTEAITFAGPEGRTLQGAWGAAAEPRGGVLVIHENRGLNDHIRSVAGRFAAQGYSSLAIDLLSEEGGTAAVGGDAEAMAALSQAPLERLVADMQAGIGELVRRLPATKVAAVGFCFGGGMVWALLGAGEPRLAAAVPFYGPAPDEPDFSGSRAAVLAIYAGLDSRVNASRETAIAAVEEAGLVHEIATFPGVDHAFFNDTGARYDSLAATRAWTRVLAWFERYLG
ncbi:MAG: dienelactone hydrolase family protein [Actinomycetota bacterium]